MTVRTTLPRAIFAWACLTSAAGVAAIPVAAHAQEPAPQLPEAFTRADEDLFEQALKPRDEEIIQAEITGAANTERWAEKEFADWQQLDASAAGRIEVKKSENKVLEQRLELAKKEKNKIDEEAIKRQLTEEKAVLGLFESMRKVSSKSLTYEEARRDAAKTRREFLESELQVLGKRKSRIESLAKGGMSGEQMTKLDEEFREIAQRTMDSFKDYSSKISKASESAKGVADAKMELIEAWSKYRQKYAK